MRHVFMLVLLSRLGLALADPSTCAGGGVCVSSHQPIVLDNPSPPPEEEEGDADEDGTANAPSLLSGFRLTVEADKARES